MSQRTSFNKNNGHPQGPELDITKLHSLPSEQQDLYLLTFSSDLVHEIGSIDAKDVSARQAHFKQEFFKILSLSTPPVTRVIRNILGRGFAHLFTKGDRKVLYETIDALSGIINAGKGEKELRTKHAAVHCLGEIFEAAGDSAISVSAVTCSSLLRLHKAASSNVGLRNSIFRALGKIAIRLGNSLDESVARDIWKLARTASSTEKSFLVQTGALWCLEQLVKNTSYFDNVNDFESLRATFFKAVDTAVSKVRHTAASLFAAALVKTFSSDVPAEPLPKLKKIKKSNRRDSGDLEDGDDIQRSESPASKKPAIRARMSFPEVLKQLSTQYVRTSTSNKARAGLAATYVRVLQQLDRGAVESHYMTAVDNLLNDILGHPNINGHRYRLLISRRFVQVILEDVVGQTVLGETAQLNAVKALVNNVLKNYPQLLKERAEPTKYAITGALSALTALLNSLGSAANSIADLCREGLLQVLQHPSYTVQVSASACLRSFVRVCPQELLPCATVCMNSVKREVGLLNTARQSHRRCVGYANGLAAVLSTGPECPVYASMEVNAGVLSLANELLKGSSNSELRVSATQIQVAWILLGGLMPYGSGFVKKLLPQLFLLWKNAFPKPLPREDLAKRSSLELSFLTHVRECALGCMLAFLEYNGRLLTPDLVRRLANLLQNSAAFLHHLPSRKATEDVSQRLSPSLQLHDHELMVRRRILQSYARLLDHSAAAAKESLLQADILTLTTSLFAHPEDRTSSSLSTSIANSAGNFETLWDVGDNHAFGVTSLLELVERDGEQGDYICEDRPWMLGRGVDADIDRTLRTCVCGAREHDSITLYVGSIEENHQLPRPPSTEVVNAAIRLFAISFPAQPTRVQESMVEQLTSFVSAPELNRDLARKAAITINVAVALLGALRATSKETNAAHGDSSAAPVAKSLRDLLQMLIIHPDHQVRNVACEALGRLCNSLGNAFTANEINQLIETIVSNREPHTRAGCAMALGSIHSHVGGMAAGYHLKTIFSILLSLTDDPHPVVHFWALEALSSVAQSAGLTFSGYVSSSVGTLARRFVSDTHNPEIPPFVSSNLEFEFSTTAMISRCLDSLINVLGPDLQDADKVRNLIMTVTAQLQEEEEPLVVIGTLRCLEHLSMYAADHVDFRSYLYRLQTYLNTPQTDVREAAIDGLYNLIKRGAERVVKTANEGLDDQIWVALDSAPDSYGIRRIIQSWLQQTCLSDPGSWIDRCQKVMKQSRAEPDTARNDPTSAKPPPELPDDEVAGFAVSTNDQDTPAGAGGTEQELLRWQVRAFAVECLSEILVAISRVNKTPESIDSATVALQERLGDVIRIAFSASTSHVLELRIRGIRIVGQILKMFGNTPDPDFPEASLLDQYQAQISSALTPAFAADSSPELASDAIGVCATFVGIGIVTKVDRMGRILRLLVSALEDFSSRSETVAIGDLKSLGPNAQIMVRSAVISAWAGLQVASKHQPYLVEVVRPYINVLAPLWLSSLKEYARLRFAPDDALNDASSAISGDVDMATGDVDRQTILSFYKDSWLNIMDAITSLIEGDMGTVFDALDGRSGNDVPKGIPNGDGINYRDEPVAFFFVLFGIVVEALLALSTKDAGVTREDILRLLMILKKILRPEVSGQAVYQETVFSETMDLLNRLVLTQSLEVQTVVVEIAKDLCISHPSSRSSTGHHDSGDTLSEDVEQLFELTRIIVVVLAGILPGLIEPSSKTPELREEVANVIQISLEALVNAAEVFPLLIKTDLYACIFHIFYTILGTPTCQAIVTPQALPILKHFVQTITSSTEQSSAHDGVVAQFRASLIRFLAVAANARRRDEDEISLSCEKNSLLASTILLSGGANILPPGDPAVKQLLDALMDRLEYSKTSTVALNCIRSLLLTTPRGEAETSIIRILLPRLIKFIIIITDDSTIMDTTDTTETISSRVCRLLTSFVATLPQPEIGTALRIVIPGFIFRASNATSSSHHLHDDQEQKHQLQNEQNKNKKLRKKIYSETAARLLELAAVDPLTFRTIVGSMTGDQKRLMENIVREGSGRRRKQRDGDGDDDDDDEGEDEEEEGDGGEGGERGSGRRSGKESNREPSIALKFDF